MPTETDILTNRGAASRVGVYAHETVLIKDKIDKEKIDQGNPVPASFGKLFTRTVDGDLYAQPLIVNDVTIRRKTQNVVYLATSRNRVYAYNADDPLAYDPLWTRSLGPAVPRDAIQPGYLNFGSEIGITSTPAIARHGDGGGGTIYLATKTYVRPAGFVEASFNYALHALDIQTGRNRVRPVSIRARLRGRRGIQFSAQLNLNRPGLLLQDGAVYLAFGSHDDQGEYYGWILAYDATTLARLAVYNTAPDWGEGGIWQSGTGLAGDGEGCVYAVVGNGRGRKGGGDDDDDKKEERPLPPTPPVVEAPVYGNSLLKLRLDREAGAFRLESWFTASDVFELNDADNDLIGGPVLFEHATPGDQTRRYLLGGGKDGKFYLADRNNLGGWAAVGAAPVIVQADKLCNFHIHGAPVVWQPSPGDTRAFVWSEKDALKAFKFTGATFDKIPQSESRYRLPENETRMPGGILSLSWDGKDPKTAILWAAHSTREDAMNKTVAGTLRAFDPLDLERELWTSDMDPSGADRLGNLAKFSPPVVANGKVYVGTFSREVAVYGFLEVNRPFGPDLGIFILRSIGAHVQQAGFSTGDKYYLRLSGIGIGVADEEFLFAAADRHPAEGAIELSARLDGVNGADYPHARAGLIVRHGLDPRDGYVAIAVTASGLGLLISRDQAPDPPPGGPAPPPGPVKAVQLVSGLKGPVELQLSVKGVEDRPGAVQVGVTIESPLIAPTQASRETIEIKFDDAADLDLKVGLFATSQSENAVAESAFPAFARFSKVRFS